MIKTANNKNMNTFIHDEMIRSYKTLILYVLKDTKIVELREIIWKKIFNYEIELENQTWYEIDLQDLYLAIEIIELYDLEIEYLD